MYSAVGSYLARVWCIFDFSFTGFPPLWAAGVLAFFSYVNFMSHHFIWDMRYVLFVCSILLFTPNHARRFMPLLVGFVLVTAFIFLAENIATYANIWLYPSQLQGWQPVPLAKFGSWYLLLIVSFVLVASLHQTELKDRTKE